MHYKGPPLDLSSLLATLERQSDPPSRDRLGLERLEALKAWREALLRRAEVGYRLEQTKQAAAAPALSGNESPMGPAGGLERFDAGSLAHAWSVAEIGSQVPDFSYYGRIRRFFARAVARPVLFLAGIVTSHQRIFNAELLELTARSGERQNLLRDAFETFAVAQRNAEAEMRTTIGALILQNLEQELRLADVECDRAWLKLAEIEKDERLARLEARLERETSWDRQGSRTGSDKVKS